MEVAAATIMGGGGKDLLSVSELRTAMQQHLRQTGTLRDIKTQLRGVMLAELMRQRAVSGGRSTAVDEEDATSSLGSWCRQVADVLVENHLRGTQRAMTLSIFASEAEVSSVMPDIAAGKGEEAEVYLSQLLGVPCSSTHFGHVAKDSAVDGAAAAASSGDGGGSVLLRWVEQSLQRDAAAAKNSATTNNMTCSTQTPIVEGEHGFDADGRPLTSLECRLAAVDAKYAITYAQLRHDSPALSRAQVERKLAEYKQQMHEQLRREYQEKYRQYEATKLQEVKDALEERYAHLIACKSEELRETERAAVAKCEQEQERLRQGREELQRQRMSLDQRQREMHDMLHDHEVEFQAQVMLQRELKERIRQLQLQLAHWEEMCASHLMEAEAARQREARRVEDVVRLRSEHAAEMQIREEELARLRFRVRVLTNSALQHGRAAGSSANNNNNNMVGDEEDAAMDQAEAYLEIQRTEALQKEIYERQQQQRAEAVQSGAMPASVGSTQPPLPAAWSRAWEAGQAHRHQAAVAAPSASSVAAAVADVVVGAGAQASPVPDAAPTTSPAEEEGHASSGAASTPSPPSPPPATEAVVMKPSSAASSASEPAKPASPTTKSSSASNQLAASVAAEDVVKDASTASAPVVAPEPSSPSLRTSAMRPDESLLTQGSGGSSLLALASRVIRSSKNLPSEHSSSSSSSSSSSARSSAAPPDVSSVKAAQDATKLSDEGNSSIMVDGERAREEQQRSCVEEEHVARSGMEAEEQTQRDGILWSQRSQWKVLQSQQSQRRAASTTDSDDEKPRDRAGGLLAQLEANRQRQQQGDGGGTQPIFRDDDSSDGDSVLFNDASTTSSF